MTTSDGKEIEDECSTFFSLKNTSQTFLDKRNDIFANLDAVEQKHEAYEKKRKESGELEKDEDLLQKLDPDEETKANREEARRGRSQSEWKSGDFPARDRSRLAADRCAPEDCDSRQRRSSSRQEGPRGSLGTFQFQAPRGRAPKSEKTPDFRKHPGKWTHYSLEHVDASDMSEASNSRAAFEFLEERRKQKEKEEGMEMAVDEKEAFNTNTAACSKGVISFSKRSKQGVESSPKGKFHDTRKVSITESEKVAGDLSEEAIEKEEEEEDGERSDRRPQPSAAFKNRKGIKRNIRTRENDN